MSNHKNCLICKESLIEHSIFTCTKCKISYHQVLNGLIIEM